jgi:hypothetical protein
MLADPALFNGLGGYSISEICHRLWVRCEISPFATASTVLQDEDKLKDILDAPMLLDKEHELYAKDYDPANLGIKQKYFRRKFRYDFLQVS